MKLITAIVRPFKVDDIRRALSTVGVHGITATEVRGFGRQKGHTELYRGAEYVADFLPKVRLEIAASDAALDDVLNTLALAARTGRVGDGKVFVTTLDEAVRVRTGEHGVAAL